MQSLYHVREHSEFPETRTWVSFEGAIIYPSICLKRYEERDQQHLRKGFLDD